MKQLFISYITIFFIVILAMIACEQTPPPPVSPATPPVTTEPASQYTPAPETSQTPAITLPQKTKPVVETRDPRLFVAQEYAREWGITVDDAFRRFELQKSFEGLQPQLLNNEKETFAGMWIQHTPEWGIAVRFTRDGEETIKKYVSPDLLCYVKVLPAELTLIELTNTQRELGSVLHNLGINCASGTYIKEGRVAFWVESFNQSKIDDAIRNGALKMPEYVDIIYISKFKSEFEDQ